MKSEKRLQERFEKREGIKWHDNIYEQLEYEKEIIEKIKRGEMKKEEEEAEEIQIKVGEEEEEGKIKINVIRPSQYKEVKVRIYVNGEEEIFDKKYEWVMKEGVDNIEVEKPMVEGIFDIRVMYEKVKLIQESKYIFKEAKGNDYIHIEKVKYQENNKEMTGIQVKIEEGKAEEGDFVCIYLASNTKNKEFIRKKCLENKTLTFFIPLSNKGTYFLKYFRKPVTEPTPSSPFIHIQRFEF
ncbi:hypothetical protein EHI8A_201200 [Entamoeba histolytica HM-1:IMSS-B]|uniref:Uncharacterized protein n=6 Tax=Entamoeba histolytica TaxID=5759 RepID=C4M4K8_ENTH1|nr:hypothetical protein EHI_031260 [Entamoeba histolytica HM-1:IMSS]EMD44299.1 Hypothetical protein EHI5A_059620 [Entamoeba histolytica KU27]EMH75347.1 hypothetical protein EHI8A_201200 [Entamoeba histolytica HM-1:IMSS-B]EMS15829.1 hypothetical protein KM1_309760 [Entamoeba histolytica HM-3:IMSS]ENY60659.1 hypothetical protein EHI7A_177710 [Entamoeba histolytica HM-1:IMSS-A]GAT96311.1 hypothetical protein CL6EHI_031260 [Entamoeba histolytica]|eukprot:XP_654080.1 hypothetical protein EHI_031260 [Entamoeba histolytica HM-1:IMSS]